MGSSDENRPRTMSGDRLVEPDVLRTDLVRNDR
jgi:hypothetical protein